MTDEYAVDAAQIDAARVLLAALEGLVSSLSAADEEGLIEHAEPMRKARAAIAAAKQEGLDAGRGGAVAERSVARSESPSSEGGEEKT